MKRPVDNFALFLWLPAVLYATLMVPELIELFRQPAKISGL